MSTVKSLHHLNKKFKKLFETYFKKVCRLKGKLAMSQIKETI